MKKESKIEAEVKAACAAILDRLNSIDDKVLIFKLLDKNPYMYKVLGLSPKDLIQQL